jgi:chromate transporter
LAWVYVQFGSLPQAVGILYGVKPVIIAIILQALWSLGRTAVKTRFLAVVGLVGLVLSFLGVNPLIVIFALGSITGLGQWISMQKKQEKPTLRSLVLLLATPLLAYVVQMAAATAYSTPSSSGLWPIFLLFLKIGSVVFGSGYVLLAFLRGDIVVHLHWLTDSQLIDAVAIGQVTPGPVFTTATFIGYLLAGPSGALVATVGIFIPAFILVAISGPLIPRIRQSHIAGAFLDGVIVASLALIAFVTYELARTALVDVATIILAIASSLLLIRFRINSAWLVLAGAVVGLLRFAL